MSRRPLVYGLTPPEDLFELAQAVRGVIERMMVIDTPDEAVRGARRTLDAVARGLETVGRRGLQVRMTPESDPGPDDLRPYYAGDATRWHYNPIFPPLRLDFDEAGVLHGTATLGLAYEGPPGCAHGGVLSLLLDQLLGQVNLRHGLPAMTGSLMVRYRRPTPLLTELGLEADPPARVSGRRHVTRGRIRCAGEITVEAEGVFVLASFETGATELPHLRRAEMARARTRTRGDE
jgi:acyl-coenzyme A thioesterase PaaI-like protein